MYKTYILSYEPAAGNYSLAQLHAFVRSNAFTYQYHSPTMGTYLIKSAAELTELVAIYQEFFDGTHFFIAEIFPTRTGGSLPIRIWEWINSATPPPLIGNFES